MPRQLQVPRFPAFLLALSFLCLFPLQLSAQRGNTISGQARLPGSQFPNQRVRVQLHVHGALMSDIYADNEGRFSFADLTPGIYELVINEEGYQPIRQTVKIHPLFIGNTVFVRIVLRPLEEEASDSPPAVVTGGNPNVVSLDDYLTKLPPAAVEAFKAGARADNKGKPEEAIRHYEKAVRLAPDFYQAHNNLGSDYLRQGNLPAAEGEFKKVVDLNQADANAYFNLGNVYYLTERFQEAEQVLREGLAKEPKSGFGYFLLGSVQVHTGAFEEADQSLEQALALDPDMPEVRLARVNLYLLQQRKEDAADELKTFIQLYPRHPMLRQAKETLRQLEESLHSAS